MKKINQDKYKKQIQKKYGIEQKIKALKDMKKRHPEKTKLINGIIKQYETGILGQKRKTNYDLDKDGVPNHKDCNPYDPKKQDFGKGYTRPRTYQGYNIDKYYYSGDEYHLLPGAEPEEKKSLFSRMFKK